MGIKSFLWVKLRIWKYKMLSSAKNIEGNFNIHQPVVLNGEGKIIIGKETHIGVIRSPYYYNGYGYIEARTPEATITIKDNVHINNNCSIISAGGEITIESNTLIGYNCHIYDSDFHEINTYDRLNTSGKIGNVLIKKNVFIGNNVTILKGVTIGENSVIGSNTVVTKDVPKNTTVGGNPMKIISELKYFNE